MPCKPACRASTPEAVSTLQPTHRVLVVLVALPLHNNAQPVGHVLDALRIAEGRGAAAEGERSAEKEQCGKLQTTGRSAARCPLPAAIQLQCGCIAALGTRGIEMLPADVVLFQCDAPTRWLPSRCRLLRRCIRMYACDA